MREDAQPQVLRVLFFTALCLQAVLEQFRRFANLYFLVVGCVMAVGAYTPAFESAISPWTTFGPLAFVISISLLVEGSADYKRHLNDAETNNASCVIYAVQMNWRRRMESQSTRRL